MPIMRDNKPTNEYAPEGQPPICIWRQGEQYIRYDHHRDNLKEAGEMIEALERERDRYKAMVAERDREILRWEEKASDLEDEIDAMLFRS